LLLLKPLRLLLLLLLLLLFLLLLLLPLLLLVLLLALLLLLLLILLVLLLLPGGVVAAGALPPGPRTPRAIGTSPPNPPLLPRMVASRTGSVAVTLGHPAGVTAPQAPRGRGKTPGRTAKQQLVAPPTGSFAAIAPRTPRGRGTTPGSAAKEQPKALLLLPGGVVAAVALTRRPETPRAPRTAP